MKTTAMLFIIAIVSLYGTVNLFGQQCNPGNAFEPISNEFMKVMISNGGDNYWDGADGQFIAPYDPSDPNPQPTALFAHALWMGGIDPAGNLKLAAQTYRQSGIDYAPGPLNAMGQTDASACSQWNQVWMVKGVELAPFVADVNDNGVIDGPIPEAIKYWPARGNQAFAQLNGFPLPDQELAPFFDNNNDGIYDASAGDYPVYRNGDPLAIPKVMAWTVFNDAGLIHTHSGGDNLNVEIHQTSWMLNADNFPALNHTLFRKDRLINKNAEPIDSFHLGMWYTGAIGCFMDDYTGSIPELNTFYFYNSSDFDPDCGDPGYGDNPPVLAHIFLDANMTSFLSYETTFTPTGIPENAVDHYEYLSGSWKDANLVEYGGSGYLQGTYPYPFMYPTNPNDTTQGAWSETLEMNPPGSRQVVGSTGPYYFDVGSIFEFDHAIYFLQDSALNHLETVDALYDIVPDIQTSHTNQYANVQMTPICVEDCVWPGDTNTDGIVDVLDVLQFANNNGYCDAARSKVSIEWTSFFNPAWPDTFDLAEGIRIEHIDCDGDGMIAPLTDMQAVVANYGETNFYFEGLSGGDVPGQVLSFQARSTDGTLIDELPLQEYHVIDMLLNLPAEEQGKIVGVAFNLTVESSNGELETTILSTPANTFDVQLALKESPTELAFGAVSSVGTPIPGSPDLILLRLIGYVDAFTDDCTVGIQISNVQAIRDDGSMLTLGNEDKVWPIAGCATTNTEDPLASDIIIDILPNPASEKVLIQTNGLQVLDLEVYDLMGRRVAVPLTWDENPSLYVNHLPKGMYLVHLQTDQGAVTKRLMVQR